MARKICISMSEMEHEDLIVKIMKETGTINKSGFIVDMIRKGVQVTMAEKLKKQPEATQRQMPVKSGLVRVSDDSFILDGRPDYAWLFHECAGVNDAP